MFPEGLGRPRAAPKVGAPAQLINALVVNAKSAIDELWIFTHHTSDRDESPLWLLRRRSRSVARARRSRIYLVTVFDEAAAGALTLSPFYCLLPLSW